MAPEEEGQLRPTLIVVAGPNGAGKTTLTERALAHDWLEGCEYVNPDAIAQDEFGDWNDPKAILKAARESARRRMLCLEEGRSLAFETVLSTEVKLGFVRQAVGKGFFVRLFFVGTDTPTINAKRVAARVMEGGHDVPIPKIISRYRKSVANLARVIPMVHRVYVYDNSVEGEMPALLFRTENGRLRKAYGTGHEWADAVKAGIGGATCQRGARSGVRPSGGSPTLQ